MDYSQEIRLLIEQRKETENVDFKQEYYNIKKDNNDLIKDVVSFANGHSTEHKFILFGVTDSGDVVGIQPSNLGDRSRVDEILHDYVEPFIQVEVGLVDYNDKKVGYIAIINNNDRPYVIKKDFGQGKGTVKQGTIFIRKGATNLKVSRDDLNCMYQKRYHREITIYNDLIRVGPFIKASSNKPDARYDPAVFGELQLDILNDSNMAWFIQYGDIEILNKYGLTKCPLYRCSDNGKTFDATYSFPAHCDERADFYCYISSDDCVHLGLNEAGESTTDLEVKVILYDKDDNIYESPTKKIVISAIGDVLHKVKANNKKLRIFLKQNKRKLLRYVQESNYMELKSILHGCNGLLSIMNLARFEDEQNALEYRLLFQLITRCIENGDGEALDIFEKEGLKKELIEYCCVTKNK